MSEPLVKRLRSIEGHVGGIVRMVERKDYCIDILQQILAVQRALQKVSGKILDGHLNHCVQEALSGSEAEKKERVLKELSDLFEAAGRR